MENNPLVSVVVPVYNQKNFLDKCLESIKKQTYSNLEVLLIDDGSNDGSEEICDRWRKRDNRIHIFHVKNGGLSYARNIGLNKATGDLITFVDSDDWVDRNMISQMVKTMIHYEVDLTFINYDELLSENNIKKAKAQNNLVTIYTRKDVIKFILEGKKLTNHVWRGIYKSKLIKSNIFPEGKNYEDMYSMLEFIRPCKKIAILNDVLYHHRLNEKAITNTWNYSNCMDYCNASFHEAELALNLYPEFRSDVVTSKVIEDALYIWNNAVRSSINGKEFQDILKNLNRLLDKYYTSTDQPLTIELQVYVIRHIKNGNKICNRIIYGFAKLKKCLIRRER